MNRDSGATVTVIIINNRNSRCSRYRWTGWRRRDTDSHNAGLWWIADCQRTLPGKRRTRYCRRGGQQPIGQPRSQRLTIYHCPGAERLGPALGACSTRTIYTSAGAIMFFTSACFPLLNDTRAWSSHYLEYSAACCASGHSSPRCVHQTRRLGHRGGSYA